MPHSKYPPFTHEILAIFKCLWFLEHLRVLHIHFLSLLIVIWLLNHVQLFATSWTAVPQASLSFTISWSLLKLMSMESVMHPTISSSVVPFSSHLQSFPASGLFPWVSSSPQVAKVLEFQLYHQSFQWILRIEFL